jgi:hypothetical protein
MLAYLEEKRTDITNQSEESDHHTYRSPFCKSPRPFGLMHSCRAHTQPPTPETRKPVVIRVSFCRSAANAIQVLI